MGWIHLPNLASSPDTGGSPSGYASLASTRKWFATSRTNRTARRSSRLEPLRVILTTLRYGMTSVPFMDDLGGARWILSLLDSRASRTRLPASASVLMTRVTSGPIHSELLARWDHDGHCWRTLQGSLMEEGHTPRPWRGSWPRSGTTQRGILYPLRPLVPRTSVGAGGASPTPSASQARSEGMIGQMRILVEQGKVTIEEAEAMIGGSLTPARMNQWFPTPQVADMPNKNANTTRWGGVNSLTEMAKTGRWPTPSAQEPGWKHRTPVDKDGNPPSSPDQRWYDKETGRLMQKGLQQAVTRWPSPRATDGSHGGPNQRGSKGDLALPAAAYWSTPKARDTRAPGGEAEKNRHTPDLPTQLGGKLNPRWVGWLMNVPIGWTSCSPLAPEDYAAWEEGAATWWQEEPDIPRTTNENDDRVGQLKALGNGVVPACVARFLRGVA